MISLTSAAITSVGLTLIITESFILEFAREYISKLSDKAGYLVKCPMCMGVWTGVGIALFYSLDPFVLAMITSVCSFIVMSCMNTLSYLSDFLYLKIEEVEAVDEEA